MAMRLLWRILDMRGRSALLRNDCLAGHLRPGEGLELATAAGGSGGGVSGSFGSRSEEGLVHACSRGTADCRMALTAAREKGRFDWQAMRVQVKLGDK